MKKFLGILLAIGILAAIFSDNDDQSSTTTTNTNTISTNAQTADMSKRSIPSDCDATSEITGKKYNVIGSAINVRNGPGESFDKIINKKATSILKTTQYISIDDTTTVFEECTKGGWSWIRVIEPDWLQDSYKGWVATKFLAKGQDISGDNYVEKISSSRAGELGFLPENACLFLASIPGMALPSGNSYGQLLGSDDYSCGTQYKDIGSGFPLSNNISYYARGTPNHAKRLRVLLNINQPDTDKEAHTVFVQAAQTLFQSAFASALPKEIAQAIADGKPGQWKHAGYAIELKKENWPTGKGHEFNFVIRDPDFVKGN